MLLQMKELRGISAAPGIAIGSAFVYMDEENPAIPRYGIRERDIDAEWRRFQEAVRKAEEDVVALRDRASAEAGAEHAQIFEAHLLMLSDPELSDQIRERLVSLKHNIEWIVWDHTRELAAKLSEASDPYLRERAIDIHDVSLRVLNHLLFRKKVSLDDLDEDVILVTHNLLPSDALIMDKNRVKGIAMDVGGRTSHTAILARAFQIPAVLGLSEATTDIEDGAKVIVDGGSGTVIIDPDAATLRDYTQRYEALHRASRENIADRDLPAETRDGRRVLLKANIEIPEEVDLARTYGAEGIGLYRSEFLFLSPGRIADEDEQYEAYRKVVAAMDGKPVTIRTLDVGGDKLIPELQTQEDKNPLLGWRAVRYCLSRRELFKTQLRALLRASDAGELRIMFPMISGLEELEQVLEVLEETKAECRERGQSFDEHIQVGAMIEIPSAAMTAEILARRSDFFSIGTNDLVQYTIAADRGNERVAYLAQPFHPAVLRLIKATIEGAHGAGIDAAMCGELAGDPNATAVLLGLGLDEFSMGSPSIPAVRRVIRGCSLEACRALADEVMAMSSYLEIEARIRSWMDERFPPDHP